jgi:hypothetical protein
MCFRDNASGAKISIFAQNENICNKNELCKYHELSTRDLSVCSAGMQGRKQCRSNL